MSKTQSRSSHLQRGFTLIEFLMIMMIIGVLASIAISSFAVYSLRSKSIEGKTLLGEIRSNQEAFRAEYDNYAEAAPNPPNLPAAKRQNWSIIPCSASCSRTAIESCTNFACIGFHPRTPVYYQYATARAISLTSDPGEFSVGARADLDSDNFYGSFTYRSANSGGNTSTLDDGASLCAGNAVAAGELVNCDAMNF